MSTFVGLDNYKQLLADSEVWRSFGNTLKYVIVTVPVGLILSLILAALLNAKIKFKSIYRTLYFLPSITMSAAVAMVWKWMFNEQMGILNSSIKALGGKGHNWLTDPKTALFMIMIVGLWMTVGYNMIILLAGMQGINKSYYEAAKVDGAGAYHPIPENHCSAADTDDFSCNDHLHYQRLPGIRYGLHDDRKNQPGLRGY